MTDFPPQPDASVPPQETPPVFNPQASMSPATPPVAPSPEPEWSSMGTWSMGIGIASLVTCGLGIILGPVAIVLGLMGRNRPGARKRSMIGITLGVIALVFWVLGAIGWALFLRDAS